MKEVNENDKTVIVILPSDVAEAGKIRHEISRVAVTGINFLLAEDISHLKEKSEIEAPSVLPFVISQVDFNSDIHKKHIDKLDTIPVPKKYSRNRFCK